MGNSKIGQFNITIPMMLPKTKPKLFISDIENVQPHHGHHTVVIVG